MSDYSGVQWTWTGKDGIPAGVEGFWDAVRDQDYDGTVEHGDLCAVYKETRNGLERFEDVLIGRYDRHRDAVDTVLRASYGRFDIDVVTAETQAFVYERAEIAEDGYQLAAFDPGDGLRDGSEKDPIDIHGVPEHVMEQLRDHGTYWNRSSGAVLATELWNDRDIRFHEEDAEDD